MSVYRDFLMPQSCQLKEVLWFPKYVNLQTKLLWCPSYLICRDFLMPGYVNVQRFYDASSISIYGDFMVPQVCQFTEVLWCTKYVNLYTHFMVPQVLQFTGILWCPRYVNLQTFYGRTPSLSIYIVYGAPSMLIYRDFVVPWVCQFTECFLV